MALAPIVPVGGHLPAAPLVAPYSGDIDQRLAMIAQAVSGKADLHGVPHFTAIQLTDPNGVVWRITVDIAGNLDTVQVPRP